MNSQGATSTMSSAEKRDLREKYMKWSGGQYITNDNNLRPLMIDYFAWDFFFPYRYIFFLSAQEIYLAGNVKTAAEIVKHE